MDMHEPGKRIGDVLGNRYRLTATLGRGGMSIVYLAEDLRLAGKRWAVKETRPSQREAIASLAEANILIQLQHPNLPEIVDYYPTDRHGYSYLVMDYIEGETLLQRFERQARRMSASQIIGYALQLCDLFHYLHSRRPEPIIYRDLKPANLMIDMEERVRLIDFGIARSFKAGQSEDTVRIGTVGFAAPEQFEGGQTDARTDLYGLGALLYYLLSGGQYYHTARKSLTELDAGVRPSLAGLVEKLLQAEPEARCQTAAETRGELQRILAEQEQEQGGVRGLVGGPGRLGSSVRRLGSGARAQGAAAPGDSAAQPRVVAVGGLYAGAGATFAALAVARALHRLGVAHAVLEAPAQQPELYGLLFGEKHAPPGYRCYDEASDGDRQQAAWTDGSTLWLPSAGMPRVQPAAGRAADASGRDSGFAGSSGGSYRIEWPLLFERLVRPVVLLDVGSDWRVAAADGLLSTAAEFIYVIDPLLHKLELKSARRNLQQLQELRESGMRVSCFANKAVTSGHTAQWLRILPESPACILPAVDFAKLTEASWLGMLAQDHPAVRRPLDRALKPWLRGWLPEGGARRRVNASHRTGRPSSAVVGDLWKTDRAGENAR
ncbi:serine/threonine protein kinase [Paenibacillus xerothermodurans]|uniref:Serine/threonine protein kinase n=1 Tax=Paenibacillus xerothermodurans TaxID=1977292 RepID=A0A2W1N9T3_PAEXE|nr:serine/threonine-protein kinase [Paenibacillus xerothermodurans]PZE20694.1 serine/threonine protein kinase [Paenibacillus xerothermodurans]